MSHRHAGPGEQPTLSDHFSTVHEIYQSKEDAWQALSALCEHDEKEDPAWPYKCRLGPIRSSGDTGFFIGTGYQYEHC
jgi:hypothetical protein